MAKSTQIEVAQRVEEILRIILDGAQFHDIAQYAAEKGWGVGERQIRSYMNKAYELLVARQEQDRPQIIARHLSQRAALAARAINAADYRTALAILNDEAKLRGLYPEQEAKDLAKLAADLAIKVVELEGRLAAQQHQGTPREHGPTPAGGGEPATNSGATPADGVVPFSTG